VALDEGRTFKPTPSTVDKFNDIRADVKPTAATKRRAAAGVRDKNKWEWTLAFEFVGNTRLMAGVCFNVTGCGVYDGKYYIDEITHKKPGGGAYTSSGKAHRVLEGY